jgi:hypothetical protein
MATAQIQFPEPLERFYYFKENQVLTAGQLNQLAGHLDYEQRLTRSKALGVGIISGLEVQVDGGNAGIRLSKGAAITSAGNLLQLDRDVFYQHIRLLQDAATVEIPDGSVRVLKLGSEAAPIPMWKLSAEATDKTTPFSTFATQNSLNDFVLVLYLDSYQKEPDDCANGNCDNMSVTQINDILAVLIPKQQLIPAENSPNRRRNLSKVSIRNVDLAKTTITSLQNLIDRYENALNGSKSSFEVAFKQIEERFPSLIKAAFDGNSPIPKWLEQLPLLISKQENKPQIQYVYDFFKDLALATNEFLDAVTDLPEHYDPTPDLFANYIMTGELVKPAGARFADFRHYFNESPLFNKGGRQREKVHFLLRRMDAMIRSFDPTPTLENGEAAIRISPSKHRATKLGERTIPFYYNLTNAPLYQFWSFEKSEQGAENSHQGYWMRGISELEEVKDPFSYELDSFDFFRVEGLLGLDLKTAKAQLEKLRVENNLGFKMEAIQIENDLVKVVPTKPIRFPELDVLFRHYREELSSNLELVKNYNQSLGEALNGVAEKTFENVRDPDGTEAYTNIKSAVQDNSQLFVNKMDTVSAKMYRPLANFQEDFVSFRKEYNDAALIGHSIDKKVTFSKQASIASPIDKLVLDNSFKKFDQLVDLFENRKTKVLKQYIFDQFFNKNPGLKHQCGVPEGGTLVLVYSNDKVVADFYLPYCCTVELEDDDDHTKPVMPTIPGIVFQPSVIPSQPKPFKWLEKFDVVKDPHLMSRFKGIDEGIVRVKELDGRIGVFEGKLPEWETKFSIWDKAKVDFEGKLDFWEKNKINVWEGRVNNWESTKINVWDGKFSKLLTTTTPTNPTPGLDFRDILDRVGVLENERVVVNDKLTNLENVQLADFRRQLDIKADKAVIDARLLGIEGKTNELTVKTTKLDTNVASFGAKVNTLENSVNAVDNKFTVFDNRIKGVEAKAVTFDTRFATVDTNLNGLRTNLEGRLNTLNTQVVNNKAEVDTRISGIRTDVTRIIRPIQ